MALGVKFTRNSAARIAGVVRRVENMPRRTTGAIARRRGIGEGLPPVRGWYKTLLSVVVGQDASEAATERPSTFVPDYFRFGPELEDDTSEP